MPIKPVTGAAEAEAQVGQIQRIGRKITVNSHYRTVKQRRILHAQGKGSTMGIGKTLGGTHSHHARYKNRLRHLSVKRADYHIAPVSRYYRIAI